MKERTLWFFNHFPLSPVIIKSICPLAWLEILIRKWNCPCCCLIQQWRMLKSLWLYSIIQQDAEGKELTQITEVVAASKSKEKQGKNWDLHHRRRMVRAWRVVLGVKEGMYTVPWYEYLSLSPSFPISQYIQAKFIMISHLNKWHWSFSWKEISLFSKWADGRPFRCEDTGFRVESKGAFRTKKGQIVMPKEMDRICNVV